MRGYGTGRRQQLRERRLLLALATSCGTTAGLFPGSSAAAAFPVWDCLDPHDLLYRYGFKFHYLFFLAVMSLFLIFMISTIRIFRAL